MTEEIVLNNSEPLDIVIPKAIPLAKSDMISLVDSLTAPLSIVNALLVAIAARREKELEKKFSELERVWEKYNVYEKHGGL